MQREINFSLAEKQSFVERGMDETRIRKLLEIIGKCREDADIEIFVYTKNSLLYEIIDVGEVNGEQIESVLTRGNVKIKPDELDFIKKVFFKDEYHISEAQFADVIMIELKKKKQF